MNEPDGPDDLDAFVVGPSVSERSPHTLKRRSIGRTPWTDDAARNPAHERGG